MILGPASSSCSFAALSAGRALFAKGAALTPMMAFLFGATNLSPQIAALAWIFLGWQFALALVLGSFAHVAIWPCSSASPIRRRWSNARGGTPPERARRVIRRKDCPPRGGTS